MKSNVKMNLLLVNMVCHLGKARIIGYPEGKDEYSRIYGESSKSTR